MNGDDKTALSDAIINKIKNNKFAAIIIVGATIATGAIVFWEKVQSFYDTNLKPQVTLEAINVVHSDAAPFRDFKGIPCAVQDKLLRVFDPGYEGERLPNNPLELSFTLSNHASIDAIIREADFVVTDTQQLAGGGPGVVEPNHVYRMDLKFEKGTQPLNLNPPYRIPGNDTGAFSIAMTPATEGTGLCWILYIVFKTNLGDLTSETFAVTMSKSRKPS
jgi:hypothetical protein